MRALSRLISIWWLACRYRLDELIPSSAPLVTKLIFWPAPLIGAGNKNVPRAERLGSFLQSQGPIYVKFGQLLSTRPDLLPNDIAKELQKLQDQVPPFDPHLFKQIVEADLGAPIDELFAQFESEPLASASLAQVHGAVLENGDRVVIKVLRPGVHQQVQKDLRLMRVLASLVDRAGSDGKRLHAPEVVADYEATILRELDLQHEAANTQILRDNFNCDTDPHPANYTPKVYWDFVRTNILVCERIQGIPVNNRAAVLEQGTDLKRLAEIGVEIFFTQVFDHNFFHADMHPGNIFIASENIDKPQYISVDCAIVGTLTDAERKSLASMLIAVFKRDYRRVAEVQINYGWVAPDTSVHEFSAEIRKVCEPIFARPLSEISFADMLVSLFSTARKFDMQVMPSLVLLEKTIINIEGLGRQLYPELDLWATAAPFLEKWWKRQHSPRQLLRDLKEKAPDYIEDLARLPALTREILEQQTKQQVGAEGRSKRLSFAVIGAAFVGIAAGLLLGATEALPQISSIAPAILGLTGLYLLVRAA
jgi:ubiquinone biosynthesis protein